MSEHILRASRPSGKFRSPKKYAQNRVCAEERCETLISRYNPREFCYKHAPAKFPRVRGVK